MNRQKRYKLTSDDFDKIEAYDRIMRDHNWIAQQAGNELNRAKMAAALKNDPALKERWEKGFVDIGIDWKTKELVVSPTMDPNVKALEAADAIAKIKPQDKAVN